VRRDVSKAGSRDILRLTLMRKRYSTWRQFFVAHGAEQVVIRYHHDAERFVTVEELYSHFRSRLLEELRKSGELSPQLAVKPQSEG